MGDDVFKKYTDAFPLVQIFDNDPLTGEVRLLISNYKFNLMLEYIAHLEGRIPTAEVEKFAYWLSDQPGCRLYKDDIPGYLALFKQRDEGRDNNG